MRRSSSATSKGADEHMYVATLGVGIQHVTRTVKESEPLSARRLILELPGLRNRCNLRGQGLGQRWQQPLCPQSDLSIVEVHPQIDAKRIFVAEDFAIQQHGTFDMAFVVQPGGKVSLLTLKAPEVGPEGGQRNQRPVYGSRRFGCRRRQWARGEDAFVSIKDMAFDPSRFLAYSSTLDTH